MNNFTSGYNCSQAVVLAFADLLPVDRATLTRISQSFGGGMGRLREVCGAVSGMFMVVGLLYGQDKAVCGSEKMEHYARIQALAHAFEEENGSIICRELLGLTIKHDSPAPEARSQAYYKKRPCTELVGMAAEILETYIKENPIA